MPKASDQALAFRAAELYLEGKFTIPRIANVLKEEFPEHAARISRETVYPLLAKARDYGLLRFSPPLEATLGDAIAEKFSLPRSSIRVVDCPSRGSIESVSAVAAEWGIELLQQLSKTVQGNIGLGLGSGRASLDFCRAFSGLLKNDPSLPKLNLVAISSSGPARRPAYCATSFFNLFPSVCVGEQIGLFGETLMRSDAIQEIKKRPGCREAFEARENIHVVVTSMGDMRDPHALLRIWYDECDVKPSWWGGKGKVTGDIQYRPYGPDGFLKEKPDDMRALTLFELDELVALAQQKDRHVVLIARQCGVCDPRRTKATALLPILKNPKMRVFSCLVLDSPTAHELLQMN